MTLKESKAKFIETWGLLGSQWGVNKSVAQVHALLLMAPRPLSTDQIMEELVISRGNAHMSLRMLVDWGIVYKRVLPGERKEYYEAEKDVWTWSHRIGAVRKQRELDPVLAVLGELRAAGITDQSEEGKEFVRQVARLDSFTRQLGKMADKVFRSAKGEMLLKLIKIVLR